MNNDTLQNAHCSEMQPDANRLKQTTNTTLLPAAIPVTVAVGIAAFAAVGLLGHILGDLLRQRPRPLVADVRAALFVGIACAFHCSFFY